MVNRNKNTDLEYLFTIFIDILSGSLINKPSDLLSCIQKIKNKNNQILFLKTIIHHRLVNDDFLISLGGNKFVFEYLPYDLSWIEIPVIKYGSKAIISATEKLSIVQICLLIDCIEDTSLIEYLVGWAFEEDKLNEIYKNVVNNIFNDRWIGNGSTNNTKCEWRIHCKFRYRRWRNFKFF